jgi:hypothetical protein
MFFQDQLFDHKVVFQHLHKGLHPFISAGLQKRGMVGSIFTLKLAGLSSFKVGCHIVRCMLESFCYGLVKFVVMHGKMYGLLQITIRYKYLTYACGSMYC